MSLRLLWLIPPPSVVGGELPRSEVCGALPLPVPLRAGTLPLPLPLPEPLRVRPSTPPRNTGRHIRGHDDKKMNRDTRLTRERRGKG